MLYVIFFFKKINFLINPLPQQRLKSSFPGVFSQRAKSTKHETFSICRKNFIQWYIWKPQDNSDHFDYQHIS